MAKKLQNKIVLITGASSGIGNACAYQFAEEGASLILAARRTDKLESTAKDLAEQGIKVLVRELDVRDNKAVEACISALPPEWKNIDILVNNAGLALDTLPIQEGNVEHWENMIQTNVNGLLYVTRQILPGMLSRNSGHIINLGSIAGHECYPFGNIYGSTKHAVKALSKSMRLDLLGSPLRVTEISPGAVHTEFSEVRWKDKKRADDYYKDFKPLKAEDVADAIVYAATRPAHVDIEEMIIMPTAQASCNHISRKGI